GRVQGVDDGDDYPGVETLPDSGRTLMLTRTDLRGRVPSTAELRATLPRAEMDVEQVLHQVRPVIEAVRDRGVEAVLEFTEKFDSVRPDRVRVPAEELRRALDELDPQVRAGLEESIARARKVHNDQRRTDVTTQVVPGGTVTERWVPVERVGLYAPGGLAVYPSSVVMNVVPAQAAGVESLVVCSPPQAEFGGRPHPVILAAAQLLGVTEAWAGGGAQAGALLADGGTDAEAGGRPPRVILAAARLLGVTEVWAVGGAQAVALLASGGADTDGAELVPADMVTGPGNVFVTAAKRQLRSLIGIDSEAGPTE